MPSAASITCMTPIPVIFQPSVFLASEYALVKNAATLALAEPPTTMNMLDMMIWQNVGSFYLNHYRVKGLLNWISDSTPNVGDVQSKGTALSILKGTFEALEKASSEGMLQDNNNEQAYANGSFAISRIASKRGHEMPKDIKDISGMEPWINRGINVFRNGSERLIEFQDLTMTLGVRLVGNGSLITVTRSEWNQLLRWRMGFLSLGTTNCYQRPRNVDLKAGSRGSTPLIELEGDSSGDEEIGFSGNIDAWPLCDNMLVVSGVNSMIDLSMSLLTEVEVPAEVHDVLWDRAVAFMIGARDWLNTEGSDAIAKMVKILEKVKRAGPSQKHYLSRALF